MHMEGATNKAARIKKEAVLTKGEAAVVKEEAARRRVAPVADVAADQALPKACRSWRGLIPDRVGRPPMPCGAT